jgi:predicted TIM-barrel fold metal-dependent hydrolase
MSTVLDRPAAKHDKGPVVARVVDLDSHEMVPNELREEIFGHTELHDVTATLIHRPADHPNAPKGPVVGDVTPINYDTVWNLKGGTAPSAIDLGRRPEVLDLMGIERQLVYPTFGLSALLMATDPRANEFFGFEAGRVDCRRVGLEAIAACNAWAARVTKTTGSRVRPVGIIVTDTVDSMISQAEQFIKEGVRALMLPGNAPPAGTSPADPALDPFWALCAEANVPVTLHLGTERGFLGSSGWSKNVEVFKPSFNSTIEFVIEPLVCATLHFAPENFVVAMVLGGVFERHPTLRFGVVELSASWVGPMANRMDMWVEEQFSKRFSGVLSMRPSDYLARNVRVTPFHFEPVDKYLECYPELSDVYAYSSDYPHFEGGKESVRVFAEKLSGVSAELRDKFFYQNGSLLLPD